MPRTRIKICGVTRTQDALAAVRAGADAIGLNFCPGSPRAISQETARAIIDALPPFIERVGVFVGMSTRKVLLTARSLGLSMIQLHCYGAADDLLVLSPFPVVRAFSWKSPDTRAEIQRFLDRCEYNEVRPTAVLIDAYSPGEVGGTGRSWNWEEAAAKEFPVPVILAGGLTPENVGWAIAVAHPYAVDVAGGVESSPGVKDEAKMLAFVKAARAAEIADAK